jgi:hypothetical protein
VNGEGDAFPASSSIATATSRSASSDGRRGCAEAVVVEALQDGARAPGIWSAAKATCGRGRVCRGVRRPRRRRAATEIAITRAAGATSSTCAAGRRRVLSSISAQPRSRRGGRAGRRVLNLFAYSGGFSIAAARGGARARDVGRQLAAGARAAEAAWRLNELAPTRPRSSRRRLRVPARRRAAGGSRRLRSAAVRAPAGRSRACPVPATRTST